MLHLGHILAALADYQPTGNEPAVTSFVVDSREAGPGSVFVAFAGERADGHAFVADAFERGAIAALVDRLPGGDWPVIDARAGAVPPTPETLLTPPVLFHVSDTLHALQTIARAWRATEHARHRHHRQRRQDLDQGADRRRAIAPLSDAQVVGQPE